MYLFDTDVLSNLMKRLPSHDLLKRVDPVHIGNQFTSSITLGELVYGARRRRSGESTGENRRMCRGKATDMSVRYRCRQVIW